MSHVIVDGVIDIPRTKAYQFNAPDAKLSPEAVSLCFSAFSDENCNVCLKLTDQDCRFILVFAHTAENYVYFRA